MIGGPKSPRRTSAQVQVKDEFRPLTEYCLEPLEVVALGLSLGSDKMDKARLLAKERGIGEFCCFGDWAIYTALRPPEDMRPPEPWTHEFLKPKFMHQARMIVTDA